MRVSGRLKWLIRLMGSDWAQGGRQRWLVVVGGTLGIFVVAEAPEGGD